MYEIIYSPTVQEKLATLKVKLVELCGEKVGKKRFIEVIDGFEIRLTFSNTGIPIKTMYDEREDFARTLFGIVTTSIETLEYWNE